MPDNTEPQPEDQQALSDWLLQLREAAGLSQEDAAETIGVSTREIRRWEKTNAPGSVNLLRLLSAYGVRFSQAPPKQIPGAVNAELQRLLGGQSTNRRLLAELQAAVAELAAGQTAVLDALRSGAVPDGDAQSRSTSTRAQRQKRA